MPARGRDFQGPAGLVLSDDVTQVAAVEAGRPRVDFVLCGRQHASGRQRLSPLQPADYGKQVLSTVLAPCAHQRGFGSVAAGHHQFATGPARFDRHRQHTPDGIQLAAQR